MLYLAQSGKTYSMRKQFAKLRHCQSTLKTTYHYPDTKYTTQETSVTMLSGPKRTKVYGKIHFNLISRKFKQSMKVEVIMVHC